MELTKELEMDKVLEKKVAFVTGGGSGIGEATAKALAQEGAQIALADLDLEGADRVVAEIVNSGGHAKSIALLQR